MLSNMEKFVTVVWFGTRTHDFESIVNVDQSEGVKDVLYFDYDDAGQCFKCLECMSNESILLVLSNSTIHKVIHNTKLWTQFNNLHQVKTIYADPKYRNHHSFENLRKVGLC